MSSKVGIIIPSYNQGKFLERTILSVLENQKNIDMDIALVDGGSVDESAEIIKKYEPYFKACVSEPDRGQADAINKGIEALPDCKYYMWLNSDDVYESAFAVSEIVNFAEQKGFEVCYGLSHFIDEHDKIIGEYPVEPFSYENLGDRCYLSQPSVLFSRKAYEKVGPLNISMKMCLDYEYWMRLAKEYELGFLDKYIGSTRMYGETKTATMQKRHLQEAITILNKYYGEVPMRWILEKVLVDHPNGIVQYIPGKVLKVLLRPVKGRVIKACAEGIKND